MSHLSSWLSFCVLIYIVTVFLAASGSAEDDSFSIGLSEENVTCGMVYSEKSGNVRLHNKSGGFGPDFAQSCNWTVEGNVLEQKGNGVFLIVSKFLLSEKDYVDITSESDSKLIRRLKDKYAPIGILTGSQNITITLVAEKTEAKDRVVDLVYVNTGCNYNITALGSGSFSSPMYDAKLPAQNISCDFHINPSSHDDNAVLVHFSHFNLPTGKVTFEDKTTFSASNPPIEFVANDNVMFKFAVPNVTTPTESFTIFYELVTKDCSGNIKLTNEVPKQDLPQALLSNLKYSSLNCRYVVLSEPGTHITFEMNKVVFPQYTDQILILDGPNRTSPVLASITASNLVELNNTFIVSSSNALWIAVTSSSVSQEFVSKLTVTQTSAGGRRNGTGTVEASSTKDFTFLLEVNSTEQVELVIDASEKLTGSASIEFFPDFSKTSKSFAKVNSSTSHWSKIVAPGNKMRIEGKDFDGNSLKSTFKGIPKGCIAYGFESSGTYQIADNCNSKCSLIIPPAVNQSSDEILLHFPIIQLDLGDNLTISKLDAARTVILSIDSTFTSLLPDIITSVNDGVTIEITRENCTTNEIVLQASYVVQKVCARSIELLKGGDTITVFSPRHPDQYPLGANCTWSVTRPSNSSSILVTMKNLNFSADSHELAIFCINNKTAPPVNQFKGPQGMELPNDMIVNDDLALKFLSPVSSGMLKSAAGFGLTFTLLDFAQNVTGKSGNVSFPDKLTEGEVFAWGITILPEKASSLNIISAVLSNNTKMETLDGKLAVYDGLSTRSIPFSLSESNNNSILSRTNSLLLVYHRETPAAALLPMNWSFASQECNQTCDNNVTCMHDSWHCNGIDDCGDWSDEKYCNAPTPPAPTYPPPHPSSPSGIPIGALVGAAAGSLVLGLLLATFIPVLYRRFERQDSNLYSSLVSGEPSVFS